MAGLDRHERAVQRTFGWAQEAASRGDLGEAVAWLTMLESLEGRLPPAWEAQRRRWVQQARGLGAVPDIDLPSTR